MVAAIELPSSAALPPPHDAPLPRPALAAQWYTSAVDYWDRQEASVDGVLGGYGHLSTPDVRDSRAFLKKVGGAVRWLR